MVDRDSKDLAVSSVIGTVLMLGITVSVFAGVSIVVLNQFDEQDETPHSSLTIMRGDAAYLLQHQGGDPVDLTAGYVRVGVSGVYIDYPLTDFAGDTADGTHWRLGEALCISCLLPGQTITGAYLVVADTLLASEGTVSTTGLADGVEFDISNAQASPAVPVKNNAVTFSATATNAGTDTATVVLLVIVDGVNLGTDSASLSAAASATLSVPWTATEGAHTIVFKLDPDNLVAETDETDNTAVLSLTVAAGVSDPGFPFEDTNGDGVYTEGEDTPVDFSEVADGTYDSGTENLVIPSSAGAISADTINFDGANLLIEVPLTATTGTLNLDSPGNIIFSGGGATQHNGRDININAGGIVDTSGAALISEGDIHITGSSIDVSGGELSINSNSRDIVLTATAGNIDLTDTTVSSEGPFDATATGAIIAVRADIDMIGSTSDLTWIAGTSIDLTDAAIDSVGDVTLNAGTTMDLSGLILRITNSGHTLLADAVGTLTASATTDLQLLSAATLEGSSATLNGMRLSNTGSTSDLLVRTTSGALSTIGATITSDGHITLTGATSVDATSATISTPNTNGKDITIQALSGNVDVRSASLNAKDQIFLTVPSLSQTVYVNLATFVDGNNKADVTPNGSSFGTPTSGGVE